MKKTILLPMIISMLSCINEKSTNNEIDKNTFIVSLNLKIVEDNIIDIFYIGESPDDQFNEEERVTLDVEGSSDYQLIKFNIPKGIIPYKFRIDLGKNINKHETQVDISSINIELNGKSIFIDSTLLDSFFQPNIYLERNYRGYLRKIVDDKYDPFIFSKPVLNKKIELEL